MNRLKHFINEIHRRALWQVVGLYLMMSWGVLNAVDVLTGFAGLPDWTPTMALVLLLPGLPIVMATAVIQKGMPGRSVTEVPDATTVEAPAEGASGTTDPAEAKTAKGANAGLFTWRNAIIGSALAGSLPIVSVGGYLVMWAAGIGPVGSLVAQGVLEERDPVLLAEFESRSEGDLGAIVSTALAVDLGQSRTVTLFGRDAVRTTLGMMGRDPNEAVTESLAREIAIRGNVKAVIAGEVSRVGTRYLLVARIVSPETGADLVIFREEGTGDDDLLPAIDRLSARLREKMGESLRTIRLGTPLEQATTSSLDALRKLTEAERAEEAGDYGTANRLLEEAVALDPAFAQAYRKIAVLRFNLGADQEAINEASTLAYEHRDRLTDRERYLAEANYHSNVTGDDDAVIRAYEAVLAVDPDDSSALNNLSNHLRMRANFEDALVLVQRAVSGPGASSVASVNLVRNRFSLGDIAGAREAMTAYQKVYPGHIYLRWADLLLAAAVDDRDGVHSTSDVVESDPDLAILHPVLLRARIAADVRHGKTREALAHATGITDVRFPVFSRSMNVALGGPDVLLWIFDDFAGAAAAVPDLLERIEFYDLPRDAGEWRYPVTTLALAGHTNAATTLFERWAGRAGPTDLDPASRDIALAMIQLSEGSVEDALTSIDRASAALRCARCVEQETALIYERLGRTSDAIAIWERVLATPLETETAPWERTVATKKLGPLYEQVADTTRALDAYNALLEAWAETDPQLQPQVESARARIAALGG